MSTRALIISALLIIILTSPVWAFFLIILYLFIQAANGG